MNGKIIYCKTSAVFFVGNKEIFTVKTVWKFETNFQCLFLDLTYVPNCFCVRLFNLFDLWKWKRNFEDCPTVNACNSRRALDQLLNSIENFIPYCILYFSNFHCLVETLRMFLSLKLVLSNTSSRVWIELQIVWHSNEAHFYLPQLWHTEKCCVGHRWFKPN